VCPDNSAAALIDSEGILLVLETICSNVDTLELLDNIVAISLYMDVADNPEVARTCSLQSTQQLPASWPGCQQDKMGSEQWTRDVYNRLFGSRFVDF